VGWDRRSLLFILGSNLGGVGPERGLRGEKEGVGVRSGPGAARTILLFHIISARPSKQPPMVRTFLKVYMEIGSYFLFLQEQNKRHHHLEGCRRKEHKYRVFADDETRRERGKRVLFIGTQFSNLYTATGYVSQRSRGCVFGVCVWCLCASMYSDILGSLSL